MTFKVKSSKQIKEENEEVIKAYREKIAEKEQELKELDSYEVEESEYDEILDDSNPKIKIGNLTYSPSQVLKNTNEVDYRIGKGEYEDSIAEDKRYDLEQEIDDLKEKIKEYE
jgi:hypothetical protein